MFGKKKEKKIKRKKSTIQEYIEAILFAFVVAMIIRNYTITMFKIPSSSMEKTLLIGDFLVGNKMRYYFTEPKREDIVIFRYPDDPVDPNDATNAPYALKNGEYKKILPPLYLNTEKLFDLRSFTAFGLTYYSKKNVVKRIIGMPGDTIEIRNKKVYVNDELFERDYAQHIHSKIIPKYQGRIYWDKKFMGSRDNLGPVTVPEGKYFVMGDNRDVSADSRYWGFLDRFDITGSPAIVTFSIGQKPAENYAEFILQSQRRSKEKTKFRWNRTFKIIK
ncbi:MAG: signal peptidase I [Candidatus Cloacimonetes bacterium]|jgi:signal peptidase I|nr:signal peptidase I [Candidatus Cloacimonadota bacterium]MBT6994832.1 signal peptidase I [Candidatus Cloacimonadota bacterium]MBT7469220.1 signal peptidase I [Candidatus Cloacimonadota bacterium]